MDALVAAAEVGETLHALPLLLPLAVVVALLEGRLLLLDDVDDMFC